MILWSNYFWLILFILTEFEARFHGKHTSPFRWCKFIVLFPIKDSNFRFPPRPVSEWSADCHYKWYKTKNMYTGSSLPRQGFGWWVFFPFVFTVRELVRFWTRSRNVSAYFSAVMETKHFCSRKGQEKLLEWRNAKDREKSKPFQSFRIRFETCTKEIEILDMFLAFINVHISAIFSIDDFNFSGSNMIPKKSTFLNPGAVFTLFLPQGNISAFKPFPYHFLFSQSLTS